MAIPSYSLIDLHTHTVYSHEAGCDDSVEDVIRDAQKIAERSGKDALIAISDHNTILGVSEAQKLLATGKYPNVQLISGAEFTVEMNVLNGMFGGKAFGKMHILAYGFNPNNKELIEFSKNFHNNKRGYLTYRELVDLMQKSGGKLIIAHPGLIKVYQKALSSYNGTNVELQRSLYDIAKNAKSSKTILKFVPGSKVVLEMIADKLKKASGGILTGMERFHPDNYSHGFDRSIEEVCQKEGFIQTAGSDFHGYHLHTEFSVGNPFTTLFQEYYKENLRDCMDYRNGLHISYLPGIEILQGKEPYKIVYPDTKEPKFITGNGEPVTYTQYKQVVSALEEDFRTRKLDNSTKRYVEQPVSKPKKSNKKSYKRKSKHKNFYYPSEDRYGPENE